MKKTKTETAPATETAAETETKPDVNGFKFGSIIGTEQVVEIIRSTGIDPNATGKRLRIVLRKIVPDDAYTKYRFPYPSETVRRIIDRYSVEVQARTSRKEISARKRETENRPAPIITLDADLTPTVSTDHVNETATTE